MEVGAKKEALKSICGIQRSQVIGFFSPVKRCWIRMEVIGNDEDSRQSGQACPAFPLKPFLSGFGEKLFFGDGKRLTGTLRFGFS